VLLAFVCPVVFTPPVLLLNRYQLSCCHTCVIQCSIRCGSLRRHLCSSCYSQAPAGTSLAPLFVDFMMLSAFVVCICQPPGAPKDNTSGHYQGHSYANGRERTSEASMSKPEPKSTIMRERLYVSSSQFAKRTSHPLRACSAVLYNGHIAKHVNACTRQYRVGPLSFVTPVHPSNRDLYYPRRFGDSGDDSDSDGDRARKERQRIDASIGGSTVCTKEEDDIEVDEQPAWKTAKTGDMVYGELFMIRSCHTLVNNQIHTLSLTINSQPNTRWMTSFITQRCLL
jgi:hypothetical protein